MKKLCLLLVVIFLSFPTLCLGQSRYGGTLIVGIAGDITKVDPHKIVPRLELIFSSLLTDSLVDSGKEFETQPGLAVSWDVSADNKEWTFHLRKGVKFHNGREVTAKDIKFNMDRILDPKSKASPRSKFKMVDAVNVVDPYTVKFILKRPSGAFLPRFYGHTASRVGIIAPECVNEDGTVTHPIGTGPFKFVEWKPNEYIKVRKFKNYWRENLPYLDEVILKPIPDPTVRLTALRTGAIDIASSLPLEDVLLLMKKPQKGFKFLPGIDSNTPWIGFNINKLPFDDVRVRRAVAYGIDKYEMQKAIDAGTAEVVNQPFSRSSRWYCNVPDIDRNVQKAKKLLKEAGYPSVKVKLSVPVFADFPMFAEIIQAQLAEIGMDVELDISDWPTFIKKGIKGELSFMIAGWTAIADPDVLYPDALTPNGVYALFLARSYNNPKMTETLAKAGVIADFNERKRLYAEAIGILMKDLPLIHLLHRKGYYGIRSRVKGFEVHPNALLVFSGGGLQYTWLDKK